LISRSRPSSLDIENDGNRDDGGLGQGSTRRDTLGGEISLDTRGPFGSVIFKSLFGLDEILDGAQVE
jgi:hypothetical protein